jgi:hypothetical protein
MIGMEEKIKAPKWVGVLGFILILCAPIEDVPSPDFGRNVAFYFLFNVPLPHSASMSQEHLMTC